MTIKTDILPEDWAAFVRFVTQRAANAGAAKVEGVLVVIGVGALIGVTFTTTGMTMHVPSVAAGFFGALAWIIVISRLRMRRMNPSPDAAVLGSREISIEEDGVRISAPCHETTYRWMGVHGIEVTSQHIFIMVDANAGIIVPRRAFASDDEREGFMNQLARFSGKSSPEPQA